jgi:opacity protein-like surface antigen
MFSRKLLFSVLLSFISLIYVYPQDEDTTEVEDTAKVENETWPNHHHHYDFTYNMFNEFSGNPTITANYGFSKTSLKDFNESFSKPNLVELKLGYTHQRSTNEEDNILKYNYKYFYVSNISVDLANNSTGSADLKTDLWRFGFGRSTGLGYKLGSAAIIPYHSYSFEWSKLRMEDTPLNTDDKNMTDLYNQSFRFGNSTEGGIKFQFIPNMSVDASYERSVIFPRHIFWAWTGGVVVEAAGQWAIDSFVNEILDSSPYAAPIVNFVLKNALSYGLYELRHDKMNWPFNTAAPLSYDQFKVGVTFVF